MFRFIIFLFLDVVAFSGVLVATLPFVINNFGGSVLLITVAFGLFSFFQFFVSPFWGNLSDKIGRKPLLILNCVAELIANILLAIATSLPIIFLARIIAGLFKTNISVGTAYIADITDEKNRAKGMGMFGVAFGLGFTFGPLGRWIDRWLELYSRNLISSCMVSFSNKLAKFNFCYHIF